MRTCTCIYKSLRVRVILLILIEEEHKTGLVCFFNLVYLLLIWSQSTRLGMKMWMVWVLLLTIIVLVEGKGKSFLNSVRLDAWDSPGFVSKQRQTFFIF